MGRFGIRARPKYLLIIATIAFYLAFLTRTFYWDGVLFSLDIEGVHRGEASAASLFHPNHLLYSALGYVLYSAAWNCGLTIRAITILQILNVFASATAGYVLYGFSKRLTGSDSLALFSWLLFTFGATWWKFSTDADSYILAVLFVLLAAIFVSKDPPKIVATAACHTLAMLFHELAIFTYVPILAAIALDVRRSKAARLWISIAYIAGSSLCVTIVYLVCYAQADHRTYPTLLAWITSYASNAGFTHSFGQIAGSYLTSYVKLFVGGKLSFIRDYFSLTVCLSLCACVAALIWAGYLLRRPDPGTSAHTNRKPGTLLLVWLLAYAIFLASWDPGSAFHKLFVWPPIVLLFSIFVADRPALRQRKKAFLAIALAIAVWNFGAFIYPHSHASADPVLALSERIDKELPKNTIIYYRVLNPDDWYLEYFAPGRLWSPLRVEGASAYMALTDHPRAPVCFETTALELFSGNPSLLAEIDPARRWDLVNNRHNVRLECLKKPLPDLPTRPDSGRRERFPR